MDKVAPFVNRSLRLGKNLTPNKLLTFQAFVPKSFIIPMQDFYTFLTKKGFLLSKLYMEDGLSIFANRRRPQYLGKWKTTSTFLSMEDDLNFFYMEDDLSFFCKRKTASIFVQWKTTSIVL